MESFTPFTSLVGGMMIGLAAAFLLLFNGRIAGISGILGGLLHARRGDTLWRMVFVAGLLAGGVVLSLSAPEMLNVQVTAKASAVMLAGLLVGIGSRMGSGCTSGHGVCGVSRLAPRSLVATATFMVAGIAAATVINRVAGGLL